MQDLNIDPFVEPVAGMNELLHFGALPWGNVEKNAYHEK